MQYALAPLVSPKHFGKMLIFVNMQCVTIAINPFYTSKQVIAARCERCEITMFAWHI